MELFAILKLIYTFATAFRDVAQPGRVRVWGACGRRFKSCHPDIKRGKWFKIIHLPLGRILRPGQKRDSVSIGFYMFNFCVLGYGS